MSPKPPASLHAAKEGVWTWFFLPDRGEGPTKQTINPGPSFPIDSSWGNPQGQPQGDRMQSSGQGLPISLTSPPREPQEPCSIHAPVCEVQRHSLAGWLVLPGSAEVQSAEALRVLRRPLVASSTCSANSTCRSFGSLARVSSSSHLGGKSSS